MQPSRSFYRTTFLFAAIVLLSLEVAIPVHAETYEFKLLNRGAVIVRDGPKTGCPCVVRVPDWISTEERAAPNANYYIYYGTHHGDYIRMSWAEDISGPWTEFNLCGRFNGRCRRGVFDITADPTRSDYGHITSPDVHVDHDLRRFIMFYHGQNQPATKTKGGISVPQVHQNFVATSSNGLNFHDPQTAGGQPGHGPRTVTHDGVTRDIWIAPAYQHAFFHRGCWYSLSKRAILAKAPKASEPFMPNKNAPFGQAWTIAQRPTAIWQRDASQVQPKYFSPAAAFLASHEFANHPNNPNPGTRVLSHDERINHVSCCLLSDDRLEVFFYIRKDPNDRFNGIYRLVYDVSDPDFNNWDVVRDKQGQVEFEVVVTPEAITQAVRAANPTGKAMYYADPISLGDSWIFVDNDSRKYLFFSYVSDRFSGEEGEGQITGIELISKE